MPKATSSGVDFGAELSPGLRVCGARYLLKRLIGRGEFSEVWLARDIRNTRDIALKFLPRALLQDANLMEFFLEEARRQTLLKHSHVVSIYEFVRDHDSAAVAMEFVDGWSLATLKVDKPDRRQNIKEIEPWIRELCDALAYAHNEFGMIHGDLKPSNLLVSMREGIKVSDFGFGAHIRNESSKRGVIKSGYSGIGFLSPQQVMGEAPVKADDIYSLGATIFDLLTGTPPFYKGEVVAQICSLKPPRMAQRLAELRIQSEPVSVVWEETVAACLAKNPADRPQSVEEVLSLLERPEPEPNATEFKEADESVPPALEQISEPTEAPPLTVAKPGPGAVVPLILSIVALFLVVGLLAAFWFVRSGKFSTVLATVNQETSAGSVDNSFKAGTGADDTVWCLAPLPDGKILISGVFMNYNGVAEHRIARLQADGALDQTFAAQLAGSVSTMMPEDNGKVIVGGLGLMPGHPGRKLVRLNADGSFDDSFGGGTYNRAVVAAAIQADGKVLVGGRFSTASNKHHVGLVRLTADGQPDDSFNIGTGPSTAVCAIEIQPDEKIVVAGEFKKFNGQNAGHLVRLNPDGSLDTGFDDGDGADESIWCIRLQKDGKILISGSFNHVNDSPCAHIARLNAGGSLDASFHAPDDLGTDLRGMALQPDGKILVAGRFNSLDGVLCGNIARLRD